MTYWRVVLLLSLTWTAAQCRTLRQIGSFTSTEGLASVRLADVNGDSRPDIIACQTESRTLNIWINDGHGSFSPGRQYATSGWCYEVMTGDVNKDGKTDLVLAHGGNSGSDISILLGTGDGSFSAGPTYAVRAYHFLGLADVDEDGWLDIVTNTMQNFPNGDVAVMFGTGGGSFREPVHSPSSPGPQMMAAGDYNKDGKIELAVACQMDDRRVIPPKITSLVQIMLPNQDGTYRIGSTIPVAQLPGYIVTADIDGDGNLDLVAQGWGASRSVVLWGLGNGDFDAKEFYTAAGAFMVAAIDFDGDGRLDIGRMGQSGFQVVPYRGGRSFGTPVTFASCVALGAVGDLDGDGRPDIVCPLYGGKNDIWLNAPSTLAGTVSATPTSPVYGEPITLSADLTPEGSSFTALKGAVTWLDSGNTVIGTATVTPREGGNEYSGTARLVLPALAPGPHTIIARYSGEEAVSTWANKSVYVGKAESSVNLSASNNSPVYGSSIVFTAAVRPLPGRNGMPTGTVSFRDNDVTLATMQLSGGMAQLSQRLAVGTHSLVVSYGGDANFVPAWASVSLTVQPMPSGGAAIVAAADGAALVAPQAIASIYGSNLAPGVAQAGTIPLPTTLNGVSVTLTDSQKVSRPAGLMYISPGQINVIVPDVAPGAVEVAVNNNGTVLKGSVEAAPVAPSLFSANGNGTGVCAGSAIRVGTGGTQTIVPVFDCGSGRCVAAPLDLGSEGEQVYLVLYGSGLRHAARITAALGGIDTRVASFGPQGSLEGLDQISLVVPRALAGRGAVDIAIAADGRPANRLTFETR